MRIPIDRRAWLGAFTLLLIAIFLRFVFVPASMLTLFVLAAHFAFFRDPKRVPPVGNMPLSPADGTISDISVVFEERFLKEEAVKIGIFLSIFVPHVSRSPV